MKKSILLIIVLCFMLSSCFGNKEFYTAQENAYRAQLEYLKAMQDKPMVEFTTPNNDKFTVNYPNIPMPQPNFKTAPNPIVSSLDIIFKSPVASILSGGWAVGELLKHSTGDTNVSDGSTYNSNSNNRTASGSGYITEDNSVDSSNHSDNSDNSDNSINDSYNQTAEPYIVEQPAPVIVDPVVVDPVVVE